MNKNDCPTYNSDLGVRLCAELKLIDEKVSYRIKNDSHVNEETITQNLLFDWSEIDKRFKFIKNQKFPTKRKEGVTGADIDIEFWIIQKDLALSFVFQAKIFKEEKNKYRSKFAYPNNTCKQLDNLIRHSNADPDKSKFPAYLLYGYIGNHSNEFAIYTKGAHSIKENFIDKTSLRHQLTKTEVLRSSCPFQYLFCYQSGFPTNKKSLIRELEKLFPNQQDNYEKAITDSPPSYISLLSSTGSLNEFPPQLKSTKFLGVLDLTNKPSK